jgi:hypothetical protein
MCTIDLIYTHHDKRNDLIYIHHDEKNLQTKQTSLLGGRVSAPPPSCCGGDFLLSLFAGICLRGLILRPVEKGYTDVVEDLLLMTLDRHF